MKSILLVGASQMAIDYFNVLKHLNCNVTIIGRGEENARKFEEATKCKVITGGLENYLNSTVIKFDAAIVAVNIDALAPNTRLLINAGIKTILVEKPGGLYQEIEEIAKLAESKNTTVLVGYNRRHYASVLKAKEIIEEDGGVSSFNFEFTEWSHLIEPLQTSELVKQQWLLANSTHVIDLAFYLGGTPKEIASFTKGALNWHPSAAAFAGAGITTKGALFSYQANWEAPGRWVVEILTPKHRLLFKPMEKLQIQKTGSVAVDFVDIDDKLDIDFKPGLYLQTKAFLENNHTNLCTITEQKNAIANYYLKMSGYNGEGK